MTSRTAGEKAGDVGAQVVGDVVRVVEELVEVERRGVVEAAGLTSLQQDGLDVQLGLFPLGSRSASTAALVGSSTQSRRRSTTSGRMTLPYSDCL